MAVGCRCSETGPFPPGPLVPLAAVVSEPAALSRWYASVTAQTVMTALPVPEFPP